MKVYFKDIDTTLTSEKFDVIKEFIKFLQEEMSLHDDVYITFTKNRDVKMTTGVRRPNHQIYVLTGGRLLIDVMRTVAHEWVHEYQHQKMGLKDTDKIQNIGGPEENMANTLSGIFVKKFDKVFPQYSDIIYGE